MKKISYKIAAAVSAATLAIASVGSVVTNASCTDRPWRVGTGDIADKDGDTSVYVNNVSNYYVHVSVYGRYSGDNYNYPVNSYKGKTIQTTDVTIPGNSKREVHQFVKEIGYPLVYVYFSSYSGNGNGWWSADTCGSYPVANP